MAHKHKDTDTHQDSASAPGAPAAAAPGARGDGGDGEDRGPRTLTTAAYDRALAAFHIELVKLQEWIRVRGLRVAVLFEGRDAAGKGGAITRITESLNPRICRVVALGTPTERERGQWYFQRYVAQLPAAGEMVLFDRSWYNRAGVERVMGFCSGEEYREFVHSCPEFERMLVRAGIILIKYWFSVSNAEQERRFQSRLTDPIRRWKLSPMDLESRTKWVDYSRAGLGHMTLDAGGKDTFLRQRRSTVQSAARCNTKHPDSAPRPHLCEIIPASLRVWMLKDSFPPASSVMCPSPSRAKDEMFLHTDIAEAPWWVVEADSKKRARLNCIHHLLSTIPYGDLTPPPLALPPRQEDTGYVRPPRTGQRFVPEVY